MKNIEKFIEFDKKAGLALRFATPEIAKEIYRVATAKETTMEALNDKTRAYVEFAAESIKRNWGNEEKINDEIQAYKYDHGLITKPKYSRIKVSKGTKISYENLKEYQEKIDPLFKLEEQATRLGDEYESYAIEMTLIDSLKNGKDFYTNAPDYLKARMK